MSIGDLSMARARLSCKEAGRGRFLVSGVGLSFSFWLQEKNKRETISNAAPGYPVFTNIKDRLKMQGVNNRYNASANG